jgi:hypothetical protein
MKKSSRKGRNQKLKREINSREEKKANQNQVRRK